MPPLTRFPRHGLIPLRPAVAWPRRRDALLRSRPARAGQQGQHIADGAFPAVWFWQRQVRLDVIPVAAAVLLLDHVAGLDQVGDDAERAALGDVQAGRDVAQAHPGVMSHAQQHPRVISQEGPARRPDKLPGSGKVLLVS